MERIACETDRHLVVGDLALPPDGYQSRFSDAVNRAEVDFLPLTDAEVTPLEGGEPVRHPFLVVGKAQVRLAYPVGGEET